MEELGFDHAWTYDHLAWRSLRDSTWFGAMPFLAAGAVGHRADTTRHARGVSQFPSSGAVRT